MGITLKVGLHLRFRVSPDLRWRYWVRRLKDAVPRGVPAIPHRDVSRSTRALNDSIWLIGDLDTVYLVVSVEIPKVLEFLGLVDMHRRGRHHCKISIPKDSHPGSRCIITCGPVGPILVNLCKRAGNMVGCCIPIRSRLKFGITKSTSLVGLLLDVLSTHLSRSFSCWHFYYYNTRSGNHPKPHF